MRGARRLFVPTLPEQGGEVRLEPEAAKHARVLRLVVGDPVILFDGDGWEAGGEVSRVGAGEVRCRVEPPHPSGIGEASVGLLVAYPKAGKLDGIVRMATEAGAGPIQPVWTDRTVGRVDPDRARRRSARLHRIAREAARQAGRAGVPELREPLPLKEAVDRVPAGAARLVGDPDASRTVAEAVGGVPSEAWIVVGPEGGLSPEERAWLADRGFLAVRLGPHTLRVETAVPVAVALVAERLRAVASAR